MLAADGQFDLEEILLVAYAQDSAIHPVDDTGYCATISGAQQDFPSIFALNTVFATNPDNVPVNNCYWATPSGTEGPPCTTPAGAGAFSFNPFCACNVPLCSTWENALDAYSLDTPTTTVEPTVQPTKQPTVQPTVQPSSMPSSVPSSAPSSVPTLPLESYPLLVSFYVDTSSSSCKSDSVSAQITLSIPGYDTVVKSFMTAPSKNGNWYTEYDETIFVDYSSFTSAIASTIRYVCVICYPNI
jgi:hypothetical protein